MIPVLLIFIFLSSAPVHAQFDFRIEPPSPDDYCYHLNKVCELREKGGIDYEGECLRYHEECLPIEGGEVESSQ
jgi:hypothetical protein